MRNVKSFSIFPKVDEKILNNVFASLLIKKKAFGVTGQVRIVFVK